MSTLTAAILAGGEFDSPVDTPSSRLDTLDEFSFVGGLEVSNATAIYKGSAVAISPNWIVTAGHNGDLNDDGLPDSTWSGSLHLPGYGTYSVSEVIIHPAFTGFANPSINNDIALMRLASQLPDGLIYPDLGSTDIGDIVTLVGFGRSGYGSYGYTSSATLTDRHFGSNVIDTLSSDNEGSELSEVFRYDFDAPSTKGYPNGSLGNDIETIIGPGDSGGAALRHMADGSWQLVGINTFTEGYGGRFGDIGGGVLVEPYRDWIYSTTGIPEPEGAMLCLTGLLVLMSWRRRWGSS